MELYEKGLNDLDNRHGGISNLEPDILEGEVKWASRGDGLPAELFKILKDDAVNVLYSVCQQIWKLSCGHRTGQGQFSFQSQRKTMPKNVQTTTQLHSSHMQAK